MQMIYITSPNLRDMRMLLWFVFFIFMYVILGMYAYSLIFDYILD